MRLPKAFRFDVDEVEVTQEGDALILRPHVEAREPWAGLKSVLARGMSTDFFAEGRHQPAMPEDRDFDGTLD